MQNLMSLSSQNGALALKNVEIFARMCYHMRMANDSWIFSAQTPLTDEQALSLHPMALAFVGDAVQSLYTRCRATVGTTCKTGALHHEVTRVVNAVAQAKEADKLLPLFDDVERDVFRRARNCKIQTSAKHAEPAEYRRASGFEAVLGYLYLTGNTERLAEFLSVCFEDCAAE